MKEDFKRGSQPVMTRKVSIVVLGKYKEIFDPFVQSCHQFNIFASIDDFVFVRDGEDINTDNIKGSKIKIIQGPEKFSMAGNGNLGLMAVPGDHDILYCGDDVRFVMHDTIKKLQDIAYSDPSIGILSPRIIGRGSPTLVNPPSGVSEVKPLEMWFPCVYIKRETIEKIGYLDEAFCNFGSDDLDFCIRTKLAGLKLCVTSDVPIIHQASPEGGPTTFCRRVGAEEWQKQQTDSYNKLQQKYGVTLTSFERFLSTGDVKWLKREGEESASPASPPSSSYEDGLLCKKQDVKEFLKTRHLFLATPAYGGWLSVNYVNSLIALIELCRELGVTRTTSFMYNESLITRARNKMANDFRRMGANCPNPNCGMPNNDFTNNVPCEKCGTRIPVPTDFFFIDADIGFDARDIIMLMLRSEEIIGAPCVRKNLRLDRVAEAAKKNGRQYTTEELEYLTGEYVLNFEKDPPSINLGQLIEVKDVGTGLMRVTREAFNKFEKAYPNRWHLPMTGESGGRVPTYMFYQAEQDEDSRAWNPGGLPDYVSEDYSFCRWAKKAGVKIWIAPWIKSTHMGSYMFKGDLEAVAKAGGSLR